MQYDNITEIIKNRLNTPIIYALEYEEGTCFLCLFGDKINDKDVFKVREKITKETNKSVDLIDLRDLPPYEALESLKNARVLYSEEDSIRSMIEMSISMDYRCQVSELKAAMERVERTGTHYLC